MNPQPSFVFRTLAPALALFVSMFASSTNAQVTINVSGVESLSFATDPAQHFLYAAQVTGNGTHYLNVINTLTNTVVGTYSYSGSGYSSQVAANSSYVFWADQGESQVKVLSISAGGVPTLTRSDGQNLATGIAALSTSYGVTLQGTGDYLNIVNNAGTLQQHVLVGSPGGTMFADTNTNLYYASITGSYKVVNTSGTILRTLSGSVVTVDSSAVHDFVYFVPSTNTHLLQQLNGSDDSVSGKSYDFGSGVSINAAAVDSSTGNVWVALAGQNKVMAFDVNLNLLGQFSVTSPEAIAFQDGSAYVHSSGASSLQLAAIPEPGTYALVAGAAGLVGAFVLRRRKVTIA